MNLPTGTLDDRLLEAVLNSLPLEVTVCDAGDIVRYYTGRGDLLFERDESMLGTDVRAHHNKHSIAIIDRMLAAFRANERDEFEFWYTSSSGAFVHIRYVALRDTAGGYLGCMEVVQDVRRARALAGEKRDLDAGE